MNYTVRVLGLHEDGEWCALALDMSLRGYGATFDEALADLQEAIAAQISFALQHDTLDSIWMPADAHYVELYQQARQEGLRHYLRSADDADMQDAEYAASDLPLPRAPSSEFEAMTS